jgi:hypothetical protein
VPVHNIARRPYYRWLASPVTANELELAYRANLQGRPVEDITI